MEFDTANDVAFADSGIRAQVGTWDCVSDFVCMDGSPNLIPIGERCLESGFSSLWINQKFPCFISEGGRYIIIFDVDEKHFTTKYYEAI
jgi:hypothetical protein